MNTPVFAIPAPKLLARNLLLCSVVLLAPGCLSDVGLDSGLDDGGGVAGGNGQTGGNHQTGGSGKTGGTGGTASGGSGGTTKACAPSECPPVPDIARLCPDGSGVGQSCQRGDDGICRVVWDECPAGCNRDSCGPIPPVAPCPGGEVPSITCEVNASGMCGWNVGVCKNVCPDAVCTIFCQYGNKLDVNGCPTCSCNPPPACTPDECGPRPAAGVSLCGLATCQRFDGGKCGWTVNNCPCARFADLKSCETDSRCTWLSPGCSGTKLSVAGCYERQDVNCGSNGDCRDGKQCVRRTVDYCAGRPERLCITCASPTNICL